jgi:inositol phosphorylceramide mannosyltransferase catalytic subunit
MIIIKFLFILILFIILEIYFHNQFKEKLILDFPKDILVDIDESITLPEIKKINEIKIYRTYYDLEIAKKFKNAWDITQKSNPHLEQIIYDDDMIEDFIIKNYSNRIYKAYQNINPKYGPAKADFFRYLIIYKYGGVYLDIKSYIKKNIDEEINENKLIVSKGQVGYYPFHFGMINQKTNKYNWEFFSGVKNFGEYNNWHIIAPAGNEVLGKVIKQIVSNIEYGIKNRDKYNNGEYSVLALTGPIMYSRVILKYGNKDNVKIYNSNLNNKVKYTINNIKHKNIGYKPHYSKIKEKNILI